MSDKYELLEALSAAVYTTDAEGRITFYNSAAAKLWGRSPELGGLWCGSWKIYTPEGALLPHDQCPMAVTLKERRPVRGVDAVAERPDGTRVPFLPYPTPLFDETGNLTGAINLLVDLTDARFLEVDRARLAAIVESSDDAIVGKRLDGVVTSWNAGAERIFGYASEEMVGHHITKIIPPELHAEEFDILARLSHGERIRHYETQRVAKDGRRIHVSLTVSPIRDARGIIIGASKVGRDITERKRAEEVQHLLINELNHRVKNTLATVEAIAHQTLRRSDSAAAFAASFSGRIKSLSRAHSLLTTEHFQRAEMSELIRDQLTLGDEADQRIKISGPAVNLGAQTALHLALVLHELGTNARKYGALSVPQGAVSVSWEVARKAERVLTLDWRETGGPKVKAPSRTGFGTTLIEQSLKPHGGQVMLKYAEGGVACSIHLPLSEETDITPIAARTSPPSKPVAAETATAASPLSGRKILLVEDETLIAMVVCDYLADAGCKVVGPAATIEAALELIEREDIDAALIDGNLCGRSVEDVSLALTRKAIPFAFVTGYGREALPAPFREALMVEKPFSQRELILAAEQMVTFSTDASIATLRSRSGA